MAGYLSGDEKITVVREVLHNNYRSCNLICPYYFWVISPKIKFNFVHQTVSHWEVRHETMISHLCKCAHTFIYCNFLSPLFSPPLPSSPHTYCTSCTLYTGLLQPCTLPSTFPLSSAHTWRSSPNMAWCKGSLPSRLSSSSNQSQPSLPSVVNSSTVATWKSRSRLR